MNKKEELTRKILGVQKQPQRKEQVNNKRPIEPIGVMTGDLEDYVDISAGARAGIPCSKSIKSTRALGEETIFEQDKTRDKKKVVANLDKQKNIIREDKSGNVQE